MSCNGEGREFDSVGRLCYCVNGQLINCCRYRQDWLDLSSEQKTRYLQAIKRVSSDPLYQPLYQTLMQQYYNSSRTLAQSLEPSNTQFLPWHRYYLQNYEDMLRMVDPTVYIPYWDWTLLSQTPYQSLVFSPIMGFGNSSDPITNCMTNGPFAEDQFSLTSVSRGGCLKRQYSQATPLLTRSELENTILGQRTFLRFFGFLTLPYLTVRCSVGGTICDLNTATPSEDPLHLLILSFIDNIWFRWQSQRTTARYDTDDSILILSSDQLTVKQYHNASSLPYNVSICYGKAVDSIDERGRREIAAATTTGSSVSLCPLQKWFVKLGLDQGEISMINALCRMFHSYSH